MSSQAEPITPHRFALALQSLTLPSLHTKAAELHNSIAHLQASNAQLAPFAIPPTSSTSLTNDSIPPDNTMIDTTDLSYDQDCADAITENEEVIVRMRTRLELLKGEVQKRGAVWVWGELDDMAAGRKPGEGSMVGGGGGTDQTEMNGHAGTNGHVGMIGANEVARVNGHESTNGMNGRVQTNGLPSTNGDVNGVDGNMAPRIVESEAAPRSGGLTDEELRRRMQQQLDDLGEDEDAGMHL